MKLLLAFITALTAATFAADTPADIAADYREKAAAALTKVNDTLEKATVPLIAALVKSGDTTGADLLKEQLQAKIAGEPVAMPQPSAAALFKSYDTARAKALEPAQKSAISRIDAILASSDGKKLDVVSELGKVRAEVEAGKVAVAPMASMSVPEWWDYHTSEAGRKMGTMTFRQDGTFELSIPTSKNPKETGTWTPGKKPGTLILECNKEKWLVVISGDSATIERPAIGVRWLQVAQQR